MNEQELVSAYRNSGTEDDLLATITEALTLTGWRWMHVRRSDLAIVQGSQGWPDVFAVKGGHVLIVELKSASGVVSDEQHAWLYELTRALYGTRGHVIVARPKDVDYVLGLITGAVPWEVLSPLDGEPVGVVIRADA